MRDGFDGSKVCGKARQKPVLTVIVSNDDGCKHAVNMMLAAH
jgi:hypothetical protein